MLIYNSYPCKGKCGRPYMKGVKRTCSICNTAAYDFEYAVIKRLALHVQQELGYQITAVGSLLPRHPTRYGTQHIATNISSAHISTKPCSTHNFSVIIPPRYQSPHPQATTTLPPLSLSSTQRSSAADLQLTAQLNSTQRTAHHSSAQLTSHSSAQLNSTQPRSAYGDI